MRIAWQRRSKPKALPWVSTVLRTVFVFFSSKCSCCNGCPQIHSICRTFAGADWATCRGRSRQPSATDNAGVVEKGRHALLEAVGALNTLTLLSRLAAWRLAVASTASTAAKTCLGDPLVKSPKLVSEDIHGKRTLRPWCRNNLFSGINVGSIWYFLRTYWVTIMASSFLGQSPPISFSCTMIPEATCLASWAWRFCKPKGCKFQIWDRYCIQY